MYTQTSVILYVYTYIPLCLECMSTRSLSLELLTLLFTRIALHSYSNSVRNPLDKKSVSSKARPRNQGMN